MPHPPARICKACWQRMRVPIPLRGPTSIPFRMFGIRPSRMNPNTCTVCELMFERVMKARKVTVDVSVLFADLRGYTAFSQWMSPAAVGSLLDAFYDECAAAVWQYDGLLNKTSGDSIMAIFNFPIRQVDHAERAVLAGQDLQRRCRERGKRFSSESNGLDPDVFGVGVGIDSGEVSFGEFGKSHRDLTAIGTVVNTASRAQSAAGAGAILVTQSVYDRASRALSGAKMETYQLKGFDRPMTLYRADAASA